jgi:hypothetical protein
MIDGKENELRCVMEHQGLTIFLCLTIGDEGFDSKSDLDIRVQRFGFFRNLDIITLSEKLASVTR